MQESLALARACLLEGAGLDENIITQVMNQLLNKKIDIADLYLQNTRQETWVLEDGIVKEGSYHIEQGAGLRAISGEKTGFASTDELTLTALLQAAKAARSIANSTGYLKHPKLIQQSQKRLYTTQNPLDSITETQKIALLHQIDTAARAYDSRVQHVTVSLSAKYDTILICDERYQLSADIRPLVRLNVNVIVEHNGKREQGSSGGGARRTLDFLHNQDQEALHYAREAVQQAIINLEAIAAPAGTLPVVLAAGWPGVLLHEAVGHGLEGDFNRKGTSAFSNALGQQVASKHCTVVDNGTLENRRGSLSIDDEGSTTQRTVLIEKGILRNYLQDRQNARLMGMQTTGNGRRESYAYLPMPRMTNTYLEAGEQAPEDIIGSIKKGLYAVNFAGGQVDITSGKFVFSASEAYLIENGKVTAPVKGATLIGDGPEVMQQISQVGNDLKLDSGIGSCGKEGQSLPVGVGQPTLKIDQLTIGGTQQG
jgi:TldD protein